MSAFIGISLIPWF